MGSKVPKNLGSSVREYRSHITGFLKSRMNFIPASKIRQYLLRAELLFKPFAWPAQASVVHNTIYSTGYRMRNEIRIAFKFCPSERFCSTPSEQVRARW